MSDEKQATSAAPSGSPQASTFNPNNSGGDATPDIKTTTTEVAVDSPRMRTKAYWDKIMLWGQANIIKQHHDTTAAQVNKHFGGDSGNGATNGDGDVNGDEISKMMPKLTETLPFGSNVTITTTETVPKDTGEADRAAVQQPAQQNDWVKKGLIVAALLGGGYLANDYIKSKDQPPAVPIDMSVEWENEYDAGQRTRSSSSSSSGSVSADAVGLDSKE